ncbi:MAG: TetR/AcrR family transcriptional regulator [Deltaproteobacteria bacterium]|nr:TetR/AcrR family transcriptional regulator [Deltaproteobacteria bacterium]
MRVKLEEREIETNVKDDALVKQRREEIIQAASKIFTEKGYHLATIRDICKASGLGPGTLYNYIKKKEDILYLIYNQLTMMLTQCLVETIENTKKDPYEQLKEALSKTTDIIWDYKDLVLLMYQETASLDRESMHNILKRESDYVALWERILERGEKQGMIIRRTRMDADIIGFLLAFIPLRRWNLKKKFREEEIKSGLIDFVIQALGISKRKK